MKYFTIEELCKTSTKIENVPNAVEKANLVCLVESVLDPIREKYGKPIIVTSGYRSEKVNKAVGGASTSQHLKGQAVDIVTKGNKDNAVLFKLILDMKKQGKIVFDQLINEYPNGLGTPSWIHISYKAIGENRGQVLIASKLKGGKTVYSSIS